MSEDVAKQIKLLDELLEQGNLFDELDEDDPRGTPLKQRLLVTEYQESA